MPGPTLVILNPHSAGGRTAKRWSHVEAKLRARLGEFEVRPTRAPRDAECIAREGVESGIRRILVVGGDGTLSEAVTGLVSHGLADRAGLALLPWGTGCDFARGLGIPADPDAAIAALANGVVRPVDVGRVHYQGADGARTSCFVNVSSFGISGLVNDLVRRAPRALGGSAAFAWAALQGIVSYRAEHVAVRVDGELVHDGPLMLAAGANAPYFGGGMHVAPGAQVDDGELDLVIVGGVSRARLLALLARGYRGGHVRDPVVSQHRCRRIEAEARSGRVPVELDGESLGTLPARYELLPAAIKLLTAPA